MHGRDLALSALSALAAFVAPVSAFFRLPCRAPVVVQRADPIVNPGALASHVHTIMGGNGFGFEMNYKSTQQSTCSSCIVAQDMSNYWVPTLYYKVRTRNSSGLIDSNINYRQEMAASFLWDRMAG